LALSRLCVTVASEIPSTLARSPRRVRQSVNSSFDKWVISAVAGAAMVEVHIWLSNNSEINLLAVFITFSSVAVEKKRWGYSGLGLLDLQELGLRIAT